MKELIEQVHLAKPYFLFVLLLLPLLWLRLRGRALGLILWRSLILSLLALALADPQSVSESTRLGERVFAFDLSNSIPTGMRRWMESSSQTILLPTNADRIFVFAGESRETEDWNQWLRRDESKVSIQPQKTNLENLLSALLRLPPAPRNVYLMTDGWETEGSIERLLPALASSGLRIFPILPSEPTKHANLSVKKLLAPHQGNQGEEIALKLMLENQSDKVIEGTVSLTRNGQALKSESVKIKPGSQMITYPVVLPEANLLAFRATFQPHQKGADVFAQDNQATAWVTVKSKEKVLLLNGRPGGGKYLEEILKRRGFDVTSQTPPSTPPPAAGYGVVILNNIEREKLTSSYLATLERSVSEGKGFLMLGGEASFAPGAYRGTPIENLIPLEPKEPKREEKNRALILVIDKSGSMREDNKLLYAKEAAKAVGDQLREQDFLGVVGFDVSPFVVIPLAPIERVRGTLAGQIDRLKPGGKTYLYPAILEAKRQLERQSAGKKHVIILSDGETGGSGSDYIDLVTVMKEELKITISTVAIGDQANIPLMKRIAQYGGGLFHHTYDPSTLPQIVLQQVPDKPKEEQPVDRDYRPMPVRESILLGGFSVGAYPVLKGFMEAEIKRGARLDLVIPKDGERAPLLASWSYGKGKSVAFASDLEGRWSKDWIQWDSLQKFWDRVFEWLRPPKESLPPHEVRINLSGKQPILDLYLFEEKAQGSLFRYTLTGATERRDGVLKRLAPGHYQVSLPISKPGEFQIDLLEEWGGRTIAYPRVGYTLNYDPASETPQGEFNIALLETLARATSGTINPDPAEILKNQEVVRTAEPVRAPLIALAAALFLFEIFLRRFLLRSIS